MKNKSLGWLILICSVLFIGLIISIYKTSAKKELIFYSDGYVSLSNSEKSEKIYFKTGTNYKRNYSKDVVFKDTKNNKQEVSKYSFVYYNNKSINFLNNGVLLDLSKINESFIPYYNIKSNYLIEYKSNKYVIETFDKDIILDNFIGKIDDRKFVVAGNNLKLKLSGSDELNTNYYYELNFIDGNLVRINNDNINIETISDECYILVGDKTKIDLSKQKIYYEDEERLDLNEIIIDNDENININYDEENSKIDITKEELEEKNNNNQTSNTINNKNSNIIEPSVEENEEIEYEIETVVDYKKVPYVDLIDSSISSRKIKIDFNVIDNDNLITGDIIVQYINLSNGEIYSKNYNNNGKTIEFIADNLTSNNKYSVSIMASYIKNEKLYKNYVMFQRVFNTNDLGIELDLNYITSNQISYILNLSDSTSVEGGQLNLYDSDGKLVDSKSFTNELVTQELFFENLNSNKKYTAKVENVKYGNVIFTNSSVAQITQKTLKYNPFKDASLISSPIAIVDKKDYIVRFDLGTIKDSDKAIKTVKYNIYDAEDNSLIKTIDKEDTSTIELKVEDEIKPFKSYYYNATITLNDNEKLIDYTTLNSNVFSVNSKEMPTIKYNKIDVTANSAKGLFKIYDADNTVDINKDIYVEYTDLNGNTHTKQLKYTSCSSDEKATTKCANLELDNLDSNQRYTINLFAFIDLKEEEILPDYNLIGAALINTEDADVIKTNIKLNELEDVSELMNKVFEAKINFSLDEDTPETVKENLSSFDIILYEGNSSLTGTYISSIHIDEDTNIIQEYFENTKIINIQDFGLTLEDLRTTHFETTGSSIISKNYVIKITNGRSGSDFVVFDPSEKYFEISDLLLDLSQDTATLENRLVKNEETIDTDYYDKNLYDDTIVGIESTAVFENKELATKIDFTIYDVTTSEKTEVLKKKFSISDFEEDTNPVIKFMFKDYEQLRRGRIYQIEYVVELDFNNDKKTDLIYPFSREDRSLAIPVKGNPENIIVPKQEPDMKLFPYISDEHSIVYKYKTIDIDETLEDKNIYYKINDAYNVVSTIECPKNSINELDRSYSCFKIEGLNKDDEYSVLNKAKLIEEKDETKDIIYNDYKFESINSVDGFDYSLDYSLNSDFTSKYNNVLSIKLIDNSENNSINKIAYYDVTLSSLNGSLKIERIASSNIKNIIKKDKEYIEKQFAKISECYDESEDMCINIDYSKIYNDSTFGEIFADLKSKDITVTITAHYDSGKISHIGSKDKEYAYQVRLLSDDNNLKYYISYSGINNLSVSALNGIYKYFIEGEQCGFLNDICKNNKSTIYHINGNYQTYDYEVTRYGVKSNLMLNNKKTIVEGIVIKELTSQEIENNSKFVYNKIIPTIEYGVKKLINGFSITPTISGVKSNELSDKELHFEICDNEECTNIIKTAKIKSGKENYTKFEGKVNENNQFILNNNISVEGAYLNVTSIDDNKGNQIPSSEYTYDYTTGKIEFKNNNYKGKKINISYNIFILGLNPESTYYLKTYMYLDSDDNKDYLATINNELYKDNIMEIKTVKPSDIIKNVKFSLTSDDDYKNRTITTSYDMDSIGGIKDLSYDIKHDDLTIYTINNVKSCNDYYSIIGNTCISKPSGYTAISKPSGYTAKISNQITGKDYKYNTDYNVTINGVIDTINGEKTVELYNGPIKLRALNEPEFTLVKTSKINDSGKPIIDLEIQVKDEDKTLLSSDSYYKVFIKKASDDDILEEPVGTCGLDTCEYTIDNLKSNNLESNTEYIIKIKYIIRTNNNTIDPEGGQSKELSYIKYTLDSSGVTIGKWSYEISKNNNKYDTVIKIGYGENIVKEPGMTYLAGINYRINYTNASGISNTFNNTVLLKEQTKTSYNIYDNTEVRNILDSLRFATIQMQTADSGNNELGDTYYQINIPDDNYVVGNVYNIYMSLYISDGKSYTQDECISPGSSNIYDEDLQECYVFDNQQYSYHYLLGGAK